MGKIFARRYREPLQVEHLPRNLSLEFSGFQTSREAFSRKHSSMGKDTNLANDRILPSDPPTPLTPLPHTALHVSRSFPVPFHAFVE